MLWYVCSTTKTNRQFRLFGVGVSKGSCIQFDFPVGKSPPSMAKSEMPWPLIATLFVTCLGDLLIGERKTLKQKTFGDERWGVQLAIFRQKCDVICVLLQYLMAGSHLGDVQHSRGRWAAGRQYGHAWAC